MLLNNQWITEEIKKETKQYLDSNENESTMIPYHSNQFNERIQ